MFKSKLFFKLFVVFVLLLLPVFIAGCSSDDDDDETGNAEPNQVSIEITPPNQAIAKGTTQQFIATGIYSDNTTVDLTPFVTWISSDEAVGTIGNAAGSEGVATSLSAGGPITITATDPATGIAGTAILTITAASLDSITVTPVNETIARETKQSFIATGIYSDMTTHDLTASVAWRSSDETVGTISNAAGSEGVATSLSAGGPITITATDPATGIAGTAILTVTGALLDSITVTPINANIALGTKESFIATGIYSDMTTHDLTSFVSWSSSDETVATISNATGSNGVAPSVNAGGPITITATDPGTGKAGTATLTVTAATLDEITVSPANRNIVRGTDQQFTATGTYSDLTTQDITSSVTWISSDTAVATISNAADFKGLAASINAGGPITITATDPATGTEGTATLTVTEASLDSVTVTPVNQHIVLGTNQQFTATGTYSDLTTQDITSSVTWISSDTAVATISNATDFKGLAASINAGGPITITATDPATGTEGTATLTVTSAPPNDPVVPNDPVIPDDPVTLDYITVIPVNANIAPGANQQFKVTGTYSDFTTYDLTSFVTWGSSDATVATISNAAGSNGMTTALATGGSITITATDPGTGKKGTATLTVTAETLDSITVTPVKPSIAPGTNQQFKATGIYSDFTKQDLTSSVTWSSSNAAVATISNAKGSQGLTTSLATGGPITITAADPATGITGTAKLTVTAATLDEITVTPANRSIALGTDQQFKATGTYSDFTTQDISSSVTWKSSDAAIATIINTAGSNGVVTSEAIGGPITITAADPSTGITGTATLTVTAASLDYITVTPVNPSIALGTNRQFIATGTYSDFTTQDLTSFVTWNSSDKAVATISNAAGSNGIATSLAVGGPITITATDPDTFIEGTATLTVTAATLDDITVTPVNRSIALGTDQQFKATGTYSDATTQDLTPSVTWTSSDTAVATISNAAGSNGVATSLSAGGPITITATDPATGKTGTAMLTVTAVTLDDITVTPANRSIALGIDHQFKATGRYSDLTTQDISSSVTWKSSDAAIATISNTAGSNGVATSLATGGPITITATDPATGKAGTATLTVTAATLDEITVTPVNRSIALGTDQQFKATGTYSDLTTQVLTSSVTWTSSDTGIATISNAAGSNGVATSLSTEGSITITATDPATGKAGTATLTVTAATLDDITVTPVNRSIALGTDQQFKATGTYSDFTTQDISSSVTWKSSDVAIAIISNTAGSNGVVTSLSTEGSITITATDPATGKAGTAKLTVTAATLDDITVTPVNRSIALGTDQQFKATGTYSDATTQDLTSFVTWISSDATVTTISNAAGSNGVATSEATGGPITITATDPATGKKGTATLTVTAETLDSITVTPVKPSIAPGTNQQFKATGIYSDFTKQDLTSSVTWSSSNAAVATISNAKGSQGLATSLATGGPITITATDPTTGKTGSSILTVTAATLDEITVTPVNRSIVLGTDQQFTAIGTYSDLTSQDLTLFVTWKSSDTAVATISNAAGSNGVATSEAIGGPITITATDPSTGITGTAKLTVTAATLDEITVTPANRSIALGTDQQFKATGTYSDLTTQVLTSSVTWTSSDTGIATIGNAAGSNGVVTSKAIGGPITITAADPSTGITGTATLTVTAASLDYITVTPVNPRIALGTNRKFIATGTYSDFTTQDLTSFVTWNSSDKAVATISNAAGSNGIATSLTVGGPITITATDPDTFIEGTAKLTVTAATLDDITVTPVNRSIALWTNQQFIATGTYSDATTQDLTPSVTWMSSDTAVATISNAAGSNGVATSLSTGGPVTITATDPATGKTGTAMLTVTAVTLDGITVTPANRSIALGIDQQFKATGTYSDLTTQDISSSVTWKSSDAAIATISNTAGSNGVATSLATGGPVTITATDPATGKTGTATLTVTAATLDDITVTPVNRRIGLLTDQQFTATGTYSDLTTQNLTPSVTWSSSDDTIATISNAAGFKGLATSLSTGGPITITATDPATGKAGSTALTVNTATLSSIGVTPVNAGIALGKNRQFKATGTYTDLSTQDLTSSVTWSSEDKTIATISNVAGFNGLATSVSTGGPITITATDPVTAKAGTAKLTVTSATLVSIEVIPVNPSIALGRTRPFIATGTYSDLTTHDLTSSVTWSSDDETIATISNAPGFKGLASAVAIGGPVTITAIDPATLMEGTASLTVTPAVLSSIDVTPLDANIAIGTDQRFIATGTYTDLTTQDLTVFVTWSSEDKTVATISNAAGFEGEATAIDTGGPVTITATDPVTLMEGTASLTVISATLTSIEVTPENPGISVGTTQQYIATGTYSDLTTQNLTSYLTWSSEDDTIATISNAPGFNGLATALAIGGPITITATDPVTLTEGTADLTVTIAPDLGGAEPFGGFGGGAGMTNEGTLTIINGDIGSTGVSTSVTGFHDSAGDVYTVTPLNDGVVNGRIYTAPPPPAGAGVGGTAITFVMATAAANDAKIAYDKISPAMLPGGMDPGAGQLGGVTLAPGIYKAAGGTYLLTGSDLTLDGQGDPNAVWVFQTAAGLTIGAPGFPRNIILINGAQAKNVFWYVGSEARIENGCNMVGTIIASAGVTISTSGEMALTTLDGRALGLNGSVTVVNTIINIPAP